MKTFLTVIAILLAMVNSAYAEEITAMDYCNQVFKTAKAIMGARQAGVELINLAPKSQSDLGKEMLINAYSSPIYYTDEYQQRAETEFANQYYLDCLVNYR